jgi:hypothetical protein
MSSNSDDSDICGENRILIRIFGHRKETTTGYWGKLHTEEVHNLNSSPNIIRSIKSRRMG